MLANKRRFIVQCHVIMCTTGNVALIKVLLFNISASRSINGRSNLLIHYAVREDAGLYMCKAENPAGNVTASATVLMKGRVKHTLTIIHYILLNIRKSH